MKLKIKNLEVFRTYANAYYQSNSNRCWNRVVIGCGETPDWYDFRVVHGGFQWTIKLGKNPDFMPHWPVEVLWKKNSQAAVRRLMETNVDVDVVRSKEKWADWISEIIDRAVSHNHNLIHS